MTTKTLTFDDIRNLPTNSKLEAKGLSEAIEGFEHYSKYKIFVDNYTALDDQYRDTNQVDPRCLNFDISIIVTDGEYVEDKEDLFKDLKYPIAKSKFTFDELVAAMEDSFSNDRKSGDRDMYDHWLWAIPAVNNVHEFILKAADNAPEDSLIVIKGWVTGVKED